MPATATRVRGSHSRTNAYKEICAILGAGGTAFTLIPIGDRKYENANRTTVTSIGQGAGDGLVWTYAPGAVSAWDELPSYHANHLHLPDVSFNGIDEALSSPDADFLSRGDGSNDFPFSVGLWAWVDAGTNGYLIAKWRGAASAVREWRLRVTGTDVFRGGVYDESEIANSFVESGASVPTDSWHHFCYTYNGVGGSAAGAGGKLYIDGLAITQGPTNHLGYVAMENTTALAHIGSRDGAAYLQGRMKGGPNGPWYTQQELTASQMAHIVKIGVGAF